MKKLQRKSNRIAVSMILLIAMIITMMPAFSLTAFGSASMESADFTDGSIEIIEGSGSGVGGDDKIDAALDLLNGGSGRDKASWSQNESGYVLTINNLSFEGPKSDSAICDPAIKLPDNTTVIVKGTNTITGEILCIGNLSFDGSGVLNVSTQEREQEDAVNSAVFARKNISVKSASINAVAGPGWLYDSQGISALGAVNIESGSVSAKGSDAYCDSVGIEAGSLKITGGTVIAEGITITEPEREARYSFGLKAESIEISGGTVTASGDTYALMGDAVTVAPGKEILASVDRKTAYNSLTQIGSIKETVFHYNPTVGEGNSWTSLELNEKVVMVGDTAAAKKIKIHTPPVAVSGISLNKTELTMTNASATETLQATVTPANAANKNITWTSSNADVATVDTNGSVTAKANGTTVITVRTADGGKEAKCTVNVNLNHEQMLITMENGINEVPAGLKDTSFNSPKKIIAELMRVATEKCGFDVNGTNSVTWDITLQIWDGQKWIAATKQNFPAEGLTVTLPYPEGTNKKDYDYTVIHMVTTAINGMSPGDTEVPKVTETDQGLEMTVHSFSPFLVAYHNTQMVVPMGDVVKTGDDAQVVLWIALMIVAAIGIGLTFVRKKSVK